MNDDVKGDLMQRSREWLQSCVNAATRSGVPEEADLEAFILAHLDGEAAHTAAAVAAAREEQREAIYDRLNTLGSAGTRSPADLGIILRIVDESPLTSTPLGDRAEKAEAERDALRVDVADLRSTCAMLRAQAEAARSACATYRCKRCHESSCIQAECHAARGVVRAMDEAKP